MINVTEVHVRTLNGNSMNVKARRIMIVAGINIDHLTNVSRNGFYYERHCFP